METPGVGPQEHRAFRPNEVLPPAEPANLLDHWRAIGADLSQRRTQSLRDLQGVTVTKPIYEYNADELAGLSEQQKIKLLLEHFDPSMKRGDPALRKFVREYDNFEKMSESTMRILADFAFDHRGKDGELESLFKRYSIPELLVYWGVQYEVTKDYRPYETYYHNFCITSGAMREYISDERIKNIMDTEKLASVVRTQMEPGYEGDEMIFLLNMAVVNHNVTDEYLEAVMPPQSISVEARVLGDLAFINYLYSPPSKAYAQALDTLYEVQRTPRDRVYQKTGLQNNIAPFIEYIAVLPPEKRRRIDTNGALHSIGVHILHNNIAPPIEQRAALIDIILSTKGEEKGRYVTIKAGDEANGCLEYISTAWPNFTKRFISRVGNEWQIDRIACQDYMEEQSRRVEHARVRLDKLRQENTAAEIEDGLADFGIDPENLQLIKNVGRVLDSVSPSEAEEVKDVDLLRQRGRKYSVDDISHSPQLIEFVGSVSGNRQFIEEPAVMNYVDLPEITDGKAVVEMHQLMQEIAEFKSKGGMVPSLDLIALAYRTNYDRAGEVFTDALSKWEQKTDERLVRTVFERSVRDVYEFIDKFYKSMETKESLFPRAEDVRDHFRTLRDKTNTIDYRHWKSGIQDVCQARIVSQEDLNAFCRAIAWAEATAPMVSLNETGEFGYHDALPPKLVQGGRQGYEGRTREQTVFADIYYQVPSGDISIRPGELLVLSGQAGSGKTVLTDAVYNATEAARKTSPPDARFVSLPTYKMKDGRKMPGRSYNVKRGGTDYESSLFEVNVKNLAGITDKISEECPKEYPFLEIMDEALVGTESWRRTLLQVAFALVLHRHYPKMTPVLVSHENEIIYRVLTALGDTGGFMVRPIAMNPETHKPMDGLSAGGGLETTAWVGLEKGIQARAEKIEIALAAGNSLDLTGFRGEGVEKETEGGVSTEGVFSKETLRELGIYPGVIDSGFFGYIYKKFQNSELFRGYDSGALVRQFSSVVYDLSKGDRATMKRYLGQAEKMLKVPAQMLKNCLLDIASSAKNLEFFFTQINGDNIGGYLDATRNTEEVRSKLASFSKYFRYLGADAVSYAGGTDIIIANLPRQRARVKEAFVDGIARSYVRSLFDLNELNYDLRMKEGMEESDTFFRKKENVPEAIWDVLKTAARNDQLVEIIADMVVSGTMEDFKSLLSEYAKRSAENGGGMVSADNLGNDVIFQQLQKAGEIRKEKKELSDQFIQEMQTEVKLRSQKGQVLKADIDSTELMEEREREAFDNIMSPLKQLTYAAISALIRGNGEGVGIKTCVPTKTLKKGQFPILMKGATDPALRLAVENKQREYVEQDFDLPDKNQDTVILNGPNKSSKTKIAQNIGLQMWARNVFGFCFADSVEVAEDFGDYVPVVSVNPESEYEEDSTFTAQARHMHNLATQIKANSARGRKSFLIIDEPFNGIGAQDKANLIASFIDWSIQYGAKLMLTNHETMVYDLLKMINEAYVELGDHPLKYIPVAMDRKRFQVQSYGEVVPSEPYDIFLEQFDNSKFAQEVVAVAKALEPFDLRIQEHLKRSSKW